MRQVDTGHLQSPKLLHTDRSGNRFVHDTEHDDNVVPLWLSEKFSEDTNVIEGALRVGHAHGALEEVHLPHLSRVVVP